MVAAYHGTKKYFNKVDFSRSGSNRGSEFGAGFYLTTDAKYAATYTAGAPGLVLEAQIDETSLFNIDDTITAPETIEAIRDALKEHFCDTHSDIFNHENFLVQPYINGITNKRVFERVQNAVSALTPSDREDSHQKWAENLTKVMRSAGFTGVFDDFDQTIAIFDAKDLPDLTLHQISEGGRPEGMPDHLKEGDVIVPKIQPDDHAPSSSDPEASLR